MLKQSLKDNNIVYKFVSVLKMYTYQINLILMICHLLKTNLYINKEFIGKLIFILVHVPTPSQVNL